VLRRAAENASDLVVLAWRGAWDGERAATVKAVLRGAPCPVMIIRSKE
jgi:nucleotide-binding universal stress UspA family protein